MRAPWAALLIAATSAVLAGAGPSGASGASGTSSTSAEEVYEIPYIIFEQTVYAPNPKTGCARPPSPTEMKYLPCEADTFKDMCRWQTRHIKEIAARKAAALKPTMDAISEAKKKLREQVIAKLGPVPDKTDTAAYAAFVAKANAMVAKLAPGIAKPIEDQLVGGLMKSEDKVLDTIKRVRETLRRAVANSPKLKPYDYMLKKILDCELSVKLNTSELDDNASMGTYFRDGTGYSRMQKSTESGDDVKLVSHRSARDHRGSDGFDLVVNPLEDTKMKCNLSLTPTTWLDCAEVNPACIKTLFHEFGHTLNSCNYYRLNRAATKTYSKVGPDHPDATEHPGTYAKFLADESLAFARTLVQATGCLSAISNPHDALPSSCQRGPDTTDEYFNRCGVNTRDGKYDPQAAHGYPSQWDEAEADFWSGTGTALWLTENYPDRESRMSAFYSIWAEQCATRSALADAWKSLSPVAPPPSTKADSDEIDDEESEATGTAVSKPPGCPLAAGVKPPPGKPWRSTHQSDAIRANRNYMRNSDLRHALGCPDRNPQIPLTCSPIHY